MCNNPSSSRSQFAITLGTNPSLVQGLLKQANGAFCASGLGSVLRVEDAIDRIGIAATRAIVLASCVEGLLSKPGAPYDAMLSAVWTHMVNTGHLARIVASSMQPMLKKRSRSPGCTTSGSL